MGYNQGIHNFAINPCENTAKQNSSPVGETISDTVIDPYNASQLYMADYDSGKIIVWDTKCQHAVKEISVFTHPISLVFDGRKLYVANMDSDKVSIIYTESDNSKTFKTKTFNVPAGSSPRYIAVSDPKIFIASLGSNNLSVIDTSNNVTTEIPIGQKQSSVEFDPIRKRLYVLDISNDTLSIVTENGKSINNIPVGKAPFNIKYNKNTHKIYVANRDSHSISIIDVDDPRLDKVKNIMVGANPTDITIDNSNKMMCIL